MFSSEAVHRYDGKADERRSCHRATLKWVVLVYFGGDQWGKLVDLSERGMCFQFEHPPTVRQSINFTFEAMGCMAIPTEGHEGKVFGDSIQATGRVKWTREFERTAGVEFVELSTKSRDQIRYWLSSGAPQAPSPSQGFGQESTKKRSKTADRKAVPFAPAALPSSTPFAPPEPAPFAAKAKPRQEVFERDLGNRESDIEVVWEPEHPAAPPTLDEPATASKKWPLKPEREAAFTPTNQDEPATPHKKRPLRAEPEAAFTATNLDEPAISPTEWPREAEPEDSFGSPTLEEPVARRQKWPVEPETAFASPGLDEPAAPPSSWPREPEPEPSYLSPTLEEAAVSGTEPDFEDSAAAPTLDEPAARPRNWRVESRPEPPEPAFAPPEFDPGTSERPAFWESKPAFASQAVPQIGFETRQRLGQTLELRQRRGRVGTLAILGFMATFGAVAGIIRFTSTFNERADTTDGVSHLLGNKPASGGAEAGAVGEMTSTFLVEVLDSANRRSVLLFSGADHANKSGRAGQDSSLPEASVMAVEQPADERKVAAIKQETPLDFTLSAPHPATSVTSENSALEAPPALAKEAPASVDAPLQSLPSPARPGTPDGPLPVGGEVQPARLIHAMLPSYPQIARANRVAGDVTLDALVDEAGSVQDVKILAGPLLLREAAKEALRRWKYEPARLDGKPTAMHLTVTVKFQSNLDNH
jgi:TonB family protein